MEDLESYLTGDLPAEQRILNDLEEAIRYSVALFEYAPFHDQYCWKYEVGASDGTNQLADHLSQSTTAMILAALCVLDKPKDFRAVTGYPVFTDFPYSDIETSTALRYRIDKATSQLIQSAKIKDISDSGTYGKDDLLTLGWLTEIAFNNDAMSLLKRIGQTMKARIKKINQIKQGISLIASAALNGESAASNAKNGRVIGDSSYLLVRFTRLILTLSTPPLNTYANLEAGQVSATMELLFQRFETRLHEQLSFYEIPDSRFDPAELVFCLEGMLHLRRESIDNGLFDRVMEVMGRAQETIAYWRTETPMLTEHKGKVLFPVSIETANSLLASFALFDGHDKLYDAKGSRYLRFIKRYWSWLEARRATASVDGNQIRGWHSENISDPKLIHTWETSQVLEFLVAFRDQLLRHMARQALIFSRLNVDRPTLRGQKIKETLRHSATWQNIMAKYEPVNTLGDEWAVYRNVGRRFYEPRVLGNRKGADWSMLLYGPPGTGKSTLAKNLAAALDVPFITVTVSDFIAGGESQVENRAKMIFETLKLQPLSVVLFDEVDQLLLDRDSQRYREQGSIFQFLTPGMLTKLANLHDAKRVIFIIATNYEERIDSAIKRPGRIDQKYLLLPLDGCARLRILESFPNISRKLRGWSSSARKRIGAASIFLGFDDLRRFEGTNTPSYIELKNKLKDAGRTTRVSAYVTRFPKVKDELRDPAGGPIEEFTALLKLADDVWDEMGESHPVRKDIEKTLATLAEADQNSERLKASMSSFCMLFPRRIFRAIGGS